MRVRDIMTGDPRSVRPEDTVKDAARVMRDGDFGAVPVIDREKHLSGIITDRDIAVRCVAEGHDGSCTVAEHMTRQTRTVRSDDDVDRAMEVMRAERVRRVPVVDDERVVGIVAQADLARQVRDEGAVEATVEKISEPK